MENSGFTKIGTLLKETFQFLFLLVIPIIILSGCASSDVSRDVASNVDLGVRNAQNLVEGTGDIADVYQNSSQLAKGVLIGGAAGAITGALYTGSVGIIPGVAIGSIFGASYGSYIDSKTNVKDQLENRGATIVILGDQILIVLPSARIFNLLTPKIKPEAYSTLQLVANFINCYTKMLVKINAYTNRTGSDSIDLALSQQQAESVSKFLQVVGMDARLIYAQGCGGTHLVENNDLGWDESQNYRIEITLEKLYV